MGGLKTAPVNGLEALDGRLLDGLKFCTEAYAALDRIRATRGGVAELRLRSTPRAKKLVEEILPIAAYVQSRYSAGRRIRVRWMGGNQPYDAQIRLSGAFVDAMRLPKVQYLEVTSALHPNAHLVREHLHQEGGAFTGRGTRRDKKTGRVVSQPTDYGTYEREDELAGFVSACLTKKRGKRYPRHTSLLVSCEVEVPLDPDEWERLVEAARRQSHSFREFVLIDLAGSRVTSP